MGLLSWLIMGALSGWIASIIMKKNDKMGAIANIVVGIAGAMLGGFLLNVILKVPGVTGFNLWSLLVSIGGACLLLFIISLIKGRKK